MPQAETNYAQFAAGLAFSDIGRAWRRINDILGFAMHAPGPELERLSTFDTVRSRAEANHTREIFVRLKLRAALRAREEFRPPCVGDKKMSNDGASDDRSSE
jgi:hypothetical protein